jgi:hypothetical protein
MSTAGLQSTLAAVGLLVVSCAGGKSGSSTPERASLSQRLSAGSPFSYSQDENGTWVPPQAEKRSSFESRDRDNAMFKGGVEGKAYSGVKELDRRSWWGGKEVAKDGYAGDTDANGLIKESSWQGQGNRAGGEVAAEAGSGFATGGYATKAAREASSKRLGRLVDVETAERRAVFKEPEVTDWQEQRRMSVGETKRLLGRD